MGHSRVHSQAAKRDARALTVLSASSIAHIADDCARIKDMHHPSTTSAPQKTGKQGPAATTCLRPCTGVDMSVGGNHRSISFILFPGNITEMMVFDQHLPPALRLAMPRG